MKEIKSIKKTPFLKKLFIKLCRYLGFELIDQSTLEFPVSSKQSSDRISIPGLKSFSLGVGETQITRKVESIDLIIKTCTGVQLVSQNKKRIFEEKKSEYSFRSIKSLCASTNKLKKIFPKISIKFTLIDIGSPTLDISKMSELIPKDFEKEIISLDKNNLKIKPVLIDKNNKEIEKNMSSTMASIYESFIKAKECKDLIYFVEDDYIHKSDSLIEMIFAYEKFASIFKKELFLLSTDYPYLYKKLDHSNILVGENCHWRTVKESLLTFLTSKEMIIKHYDKLIDMAKNESNPYEKKLHEIYEEELCLSPIPSLSIHCTNANSVFGLSPNVNIKKLWEDFK